MTDQERERIFQTAVQQLARMDAERKARQLEREAALADLWKPGQSPRDLTNVHGK
jgi:hypothetical protein